MTERVVFRESSYREDVEQSPKIESALEQSHPRTESTSKRESLKVGPGLANLGNTCFLNSALQCLVHIPPLFSHLSSRQHSSACLTKTVCIFCELEKHVHVCFKAEIKKRTVAPSAIVSNLRQIAPHFKPGRQEDAHEFLILLLDALQRSLTTRTAKERTIVSALFEGCFKSRIVCSECNASSDSQDMFRDISLNIRGADTLHRALGLFTAPEQLVDDNRYMCYQCRKYVSASKTIWIQNCPPVLILHLKRFVHHGKESKITKMVRFEEDLDLGPYTFEGKRRIYKLVSVLVHDGKLCRSGHYYSFVKGSGGIWYVMDDGAVRSVGKSTVLGQPAYILFYIAVGQKSE